MFFRHKNRKTLAERQEKNLTKTLHLTLGGQLRGFCKIFRRKMGGCLGFFAENELIPLGRHARFHSATTGVAG